MAIKQEVQTVNGEPVYFQTSSDMVIDEETGTSVQTDINSLKKSVAMLSSSSSGVKEAVTEVSEKTDELSTKVDDVSTKVDNLSTKMDNLQFEDVQVVQCILDGLKYKDFEEGELPYSFAYGAKAVVYRGEIHILGGAADPIDEEVYNYHYKWNGTSWVKASTLPYKFNNGCVVVYNDCIHIFGGTNHHKWNGSTWTKCIDNPYDVWYCSAAVMDGWVYIFGGNASNYYYKWCTYREYVDEDGVSQSGWNTDLLDATAPCNLRNSSAVECNGEIYVATDSNELYKYAIDWTLVAKIPGSFDTYDGGLVALNDKIHILGISSEYAGKSINHRVWDGGKLTLSPVLPCSIYNAHAVVLDGEIHIFKGKKHYTVDVPLVSMYLKKDTKIYLDEKVRTVTNCHYDTDHIVVESDGTVEFTIAGCETAMLTIVK